MKKIKEQYQGLIITFFSPGIGNVTFDPSKVIPNDYPNFEKIGLDYIFEEIKEPKLPIKKGRKSMKEKMEKGEL